MADRPILFSGPMIRCLACDDTGIVPSIEGEDRPCSRCRAEDFNEWSEKRRPVPQPESEAP